MIEAKAPILNSSSASRFAKTIATSNPKDIWKQEDIGGGITLFGFFQFELKVDKKGNWSCQIKSVSKTNIKIFLEYNGYRKVYIPKTNMYVFTNVQDNVIKVVKIDIIRNFCYDELKSKKGLILEAGTEHEFVFTEKLLDTIYLRYQDQIFNVNFLELLQEFKMPELRDSRFNSFFLFKNTIVEVNGDSYSLLPYRSLIEMGKCVWESHIMERDFKISDSLPSSEFERFIANVSDKRDDRINAARSAIGYLLHNYNGSHLGQAVVLYDEQPTDVKNPQGGTGKGLFSQAFLHMRETIKLDGKHYRGDDKFRFQPVNNTTQIVWVDDLSKDQDFDSFFSAITDGFTIEKKNKDLIQIEADKSPKMLFSMNTVIQGNGSSHLRRIFVLEFSNYYSRQLVTGSEKPIADEHGFFFDRYEWTNDNWNSFTKYMIECIQYFLKNGLQPYELINVGRNALIQQTNEDFSDWVVEQDFKVDIYYKTKLLFEQYKERYFGENADYKQMSFTNMLKKYASAKKWEFKMVQDSVSKTSEFVFKEKVFSEKTSQIQF